MRIVVQVVHGSIPQQGLSGAPRPNETDSRKLKLPQENGDELEETPLRAIGEMETVHDEEDHDEFDHLGHDFADGGVLPEPLCSGPQSLPHPARHLLLRFRNEGEDAGCGRDRLYQRTPEGPGAMLSPQQDG